MSASALFAKDLRGRVAPAVAEPRARGIRRLLAVLLVACTAQAASVQAGLNLSWDDCRAGGGSASTSFACDSSTGPPLTMVASVVIPADMPMFAAASVIIDVYVTGSALPAWWQTSAGQCRDGAITVSFDSSALDATGCPSIWAGTPTLYVFQTQPGLVVPYRMRLNAGAAVPQGAELSWVADGRELAVALIAISRAKSVGEDACAGCLVPACMQYQESKLYQSGDLGDFTIDTGAGFYTNFAFLNATGPYVTIENAWWPCSIVPTRNRTWGAIKTLYR